MKTNVVVAVYDPPEEGLPYLTVALVSNQVVEAVVADTAAEAQHFLDRIAFELDGLDDCRSNQTR